MFLTFDAPTRDACSARRLASNTPLQALTVWNDPAFMELAQAMAARMEESGGTIPEMIAHGCRLLTLSAPPASMVDSLSKLYEKSRDEYRRNAEASMELASTPERAALTLVANTILNLDAAFTR